MSTRKEVCAAAKEMAATQKEIHKINEIKRRYRDKERNCSILNTLSFFWLIFRVIQDIKRDKDLRAEVCENVTSRLTLPEIIETIAKDIYCPSNDSYYFFYESAKQRLKEQSAQNFTDFCADRGL